jgi:hypothetical protein
MIGQISLSVAYGIDTAPRNDPNIALADEALQGVEAAVKRGRIFNLVPFRKLNQLWPSYCRDIELSGSHPLAVVVPKRWL